MSPEQLETGKKVFGRITELKRAMNCFEVDFQDGNGVQTTNPKLLIEFNDVENEWERSIIPLDIILNDEFICKIKEYLSREIQQLESVFEGL